MPTFTIQSPRTGKSYQIEGQGVPTEDDINEIGAHLDAQEAQRAGVDPAILNQGPTGTVVNQVRNIGPELLDQTVGGLAKLNDAVGRSPLAPLMPLGMISQAVKQFTGAPQSPLENVSKFTGTVRDIGTEMRPTNPFNPTAQTIGSAVNQVGGMLATGGLATAAGMPAAQAMTVIPGAMGFASGAGQGVDTAVQMGITDPTTQAAMGLGFGTVEMATERLGGIGGDVVGKFIKPSSLLGRTALNVASEGGEEVLAGRAQDALTLAAGQTVADPQRPGFTRSGYDLPSLNPLNPRTLEQMKQEAIGGAVGGVIFSGLQGLSPHELSPNQAAPTPPPTQSAAAAAAAGAPLPGLEEHTGELTAADVAGLDQNISPAQTTTGSNVQTGTAMPVPPPTADAGAGAGAGAGPIRRMVPRFRDAGVGQMMSDPTADLGRDFGLKRQAPPFRDNPLAQTPTAEGNLITDLRVPRSPQAIAESQRLEQERLAQNARLRSIDAKAGRGPLIPDSPLGVYDILDFVNENRIRIPKKGESTDGSYDWTETYSIPQYYRQFLGNTEKGAHIDQVAQAAYDHHFIAEPTADALMGAIQQTIDTRKQYRFELAKQQREQQQAATRASDFEKTQGKLRSADKDRIAFDDLAPGDQLTIDGEQVHVADVSYDQDGYLTNVVLQDGKRFGVMQFDPQQRGGIFVDEFMPKSLGSELPPPLMLPRQGSPGVTSVAQQAADVAHGRQWGDVSPSLKASMLTPGAPGAAAPTSGPRGLAKLFAQPAPPAAETPPASPVTQEPGTTNQEQAPTLAAAYAAASQGQSTAYLPIHAVWQQAQAQNPALTPDQFVDDIMQRYEAGEVYLEGANTRQEAEAAPMAIHQTAVGTAVRMAMPQPSNYRDVREELEGLQNPASRGKEAAMASDSGAAQASGTLASPATLAANQRTNEAILRDLGLPTEKGTRVWGVAKVKAALGKLAADTRYPATTRLMAGVLSELSLSNLLLKIEADARLNWAGLYQPFGDGRGELSLNTRTMGRGEFDIGISLVHEALHHATWQALRAPRTAQQKQAKADLETLFQRAKAALATGGQFAAFDYELSNLDEFITGLFTRADFQTALASIPLEAAPKTLGQRVRSVLDEIFRVLSELVTSKKVETGSVLEASMAATLRLMGDGQRSVQARLNNAVMTQGPGPVSIRPPGMRAVTAYHGTPHKVDKFSTSKIGTGEGAQAYGWGLYFAENEAVAKGYHETLSRQQDNYVVDGVPADYENPVHRAAGAVHDFKTRAKAIAHIEQMVSGFRQRPQTPATNAELKKIEGTLAVLKSKAKLPTYSKAGGVYTVELLPDESEFLDWDKPLSEQSEKVKAALQPIIDELVSPADQAEFVRMGGRLYKASTTPLRWAAKTLYRQLAENPAQSSKRLASLGIPGIKYLDAGSRGAGDGSRNFVVFDDKHIRITAENGQPVTDWANADRPAPLMNPAAAQNETQSRFASPNAADRVINGPRTDELVAAEADAWLDTVDTQMAVEMFAAQAVPLPLDAQENAAAKLIVRLSEQTTNGKTEVQRLWAHVQSQRMSRIWTTEFLSADPARALRQRGVVNNAILGPMAGVLAAQDILIDRAKAAIEPRFDGGTEGVTEKVKDIATKADATAGEELAGQLDGAEPAESPDATDATEDAPELGDNEDIQPGNDPRIADLEARLKEMRAQMDAGDAAMQETTSTWQKIMDLMNAASARKSQLLNGAKSKIASMREAAKARKAARRAEGRLSANPVEDFADDAIIGASLLAEGIVEFANWSQAMIRELGARSSADLKQLYAAASKEYLKALEAEQGRKPGKRTPGRKKINAAQRTAQNILDDLASRYADPPLFKEGQRKVNAMRELYKEHVRTPMSEEAFVSRAEALGAKPGTSGILWEAAQLEIAAREMMANERRLAAQRRKVEVAENRASQLIYKTEERLRQGSKDLTTNQGGDTINKVFRDEVSKPMAWAAFSQRLAALNVGPEVAARLYKTAARERTDLQAAEDYKAQQKSLALLNKDNPALAKMLNDLRKKMFPVPDPRRPGFTRPMKWAEIFAELPATQKERQLEIYKRLMKDERLKALNQQERLALTNELDKAWQRERRKVFMRELEKAKVLGEKAPIDREKVKAAAPRLLRLMNLGMLNSDLFREALAKEYGIKQIDATTGGELRKLGEAIQQAPEGLPRRKLETKLLERLQELTGSTFWQIIDSWWTAGVLSGWRTQVDIGLGIANGIEDVGLGSVVTALRTGNKDVALQALGSLFARIPSAFLEAVDHVATGNKSMMRNFELEAKQALEGGNRLASDVGGELWRKGGWRKVPGGFMIFYGRLLTALDHINSASTREGAKAMALARHPDLYQRALRVSAADKAAARTQARTELTAGVAPINRQQRLEEEARVREILEQTIPVEVIDEATAIGRQAALQGDPTGLGGGLLDMVNAAVGMVARKAEAMGKREGRDPKSNQVLKLLQGTAPLARAITGTKFARTVAHSLNRTLSYIPGVGAYAVGQQGRTGAFGDILAAKQVIGTLVGIALYLAFDDDDDEKGIEDGWKDKTPQEKAQLYAQGKQPFSVWQRTANGRVVSFNYQQWGIAGVMNTVAQMHKKKASEDGALNVLLSSLVQGGMIFTDKAQLQGLQTVLGENTRSTDPAKGIASNLNKWAAQTVGGLVPRLAKDIDMVLSPELRTSSDWWARWTKEVPMVRELSSGKRVDIFGADIKLDRGPLSRVMQMGTEDPVYRLLGKLNERDIFLPDPSQGVRVVRLNDGTRRPMTPQEKDRYQRLTGEGYRQFIQEQGAELLKLHTTAPDRVKDIVHLRTQIIRDRAAYQATH